MILVTGATGYVGRRLIRVLANRYGADSIICLAYDQADDELERTGRSILGELKIRYIPVDLVSGRGLENVPKSPSLVFHLASNTDTGAADHSINDVGTRHLLEAIQPLPPEAHFIFTSTIAVADHRKDQRKPVNEETPLLRPYNDYGRRKLTAEKYLENCAREKNFALTIVRLCAVYGQGTRAGGLFERLSALVSSDSVIARFNYPGKLSFINVDDIANVLTILSERPPRSGRSDLFIPVAEVMTISELIECYYSAFNINYRPIRFPQLFWKLCNFVANLSYRLEPVLPHSINNRIWQLGLLVGSGFHNDSNKLHLVFPNLKLKQFKEVVGELIR